MTEVLKVNVDENFSMSFLTANVIYKAGGKNWGDALALYIRYIQQSKWQHTNQPYCNDAYMIKWLGRGRTKFYKVKKILTDLNLIETMRDNTWEKTYIKIYYLVSWEKTKELITQELSSPFYMTAKFEDSKNQEIKEESQNSTESCIDNADTCIDNANRCIDNANRCIDYRYTENRYTENGTQMLKVNKINAWNKKDKCFPETPDEVSVVPEDVNNTGLDDDTFMFNDGSIEFYTKSVLQQTKLEDKMNILWQFFPHFVWYKWKKKDVIKALKQFTLDYDFVYGLIYDMKLLAFQCEYWLVKRQWFMSQWIDTYTPLSEKERDKQLYKVIEYIKRHKEDQSTFEKRAQEMIAFIGYPKYHEIFRSIPANVGDRVILDLS